MSQPIILIGIGTGGKKALDNTWKFISEISPENREDIHIQYIFLETDKGNTETDTSEMMNAPLSIENTTLTVNNIISSGASTEWLPAENQNGRYEGLADSALDGAGGIPIMGRVCLWDNNNFNNFRNKLNTARDAFISQEVLENPIVFITGTLAGGTGSGTFIDIAYIVRDYFQDMVEVNAVLSIPGTEYILKEQIMYCNTVGALKGLAYINTPGNTYTYRWANSTRPKGYERKPFDAIQLISSEFDRKLGYESYDDLCNNIGLFLFLNAIGMYSVRWASLTDANGNGIISKYTTYGLSAIRYPKAQITEMIAYEISEELLSRWIDQINYYDKVGNKIEINTQKDGIYNETVRTFESFIGNCLQDWSKKIKVNEKNSLDEEIAEVVEKLCSKDSSTKEKKEELYRLFRSGGSFHSVMNNNLTIVKNDIIDYIYQEVADTLIKYENLPLALIKLEAISQSIEKIINYWKFLGVTPDPASWDQKLKTEILHLLPYEYRTLPEKKNVYSDRLKYELVSMLTMHVFARTISTLSKNIKSGKEQIYSKSQNLESASENKESIKRILPTIPQLKHYIEIVTNTLSSEESSNYKSIRKTKTKLKDSITNSTHKTLSLIFANGTIDNDIDSGLTKYRATKEGKKPSVNDLTDSIDTNLWEYLSQRDISNQLNINLFESVSTKYYNIINKTDIVGDFNIADLINVQDKKVIKTVVNTGEKALIPHFPVNPDNKAIFIDNEKIPRIIAGVDPTELQKIEKVLNNSGFSNFSVKDVKRHVFGHPGLSNWLIFFKEFGRMSEQRGFNPVIDFRHYKDYVTIFKNEANRNISQGLVSSLDMWNRIRIPYVSLTNISEAYTKTIELADNYQKHQEYEEAIVSYKMAKDWDSTHQYPDQQIENIQKILFEEKISDRKQRYCDIAERYKQEQKIMQAKHYLELANNLEKNSFIESQITEIDNQILASSEYCKKGETILKNAEEKYNIARKNGDYTLFQEIRQQFTKAQEFFEEALAKNPENTFIDERLSIINNYINAIK